MGEQRQEVMNQNEILKNITKGVWETHEEEHPEEIRVEENGNFRYLGTMSADNGEEEADWANAAAICHAVNHTYGMKIDPTKVPEMVALLHEISNMHPDGNPAKMIQKAQSLLTSAKLEP